MENKVESKEKSKVLINYNEAPIDTDLRSSLKKAEEAKWEKKVEKQEPLPFESNQEVKDFLNDLYKTMENVTGKKVITRVPYGINESSVQKLWLDTAFIKKTIRESVYTACGINEDLKKNNVPQNIIKWAIDKLLDTPEEIVRRFKKDTKKCIKALISLMKRWWEVLLSKIEQQFWNVSIDSPREQYNTWRKSAWIILALLD